MNQLKDSTYTGERALFSLKDAEITNCIFEDGESPLKESRNLVINKTTFKWKYPIWYSENVKCDDIHIENTARSGIWYTKNITITNSLIESSKTFRYAENALLEKCKIPNASETFWNCKGIRLIDVEVKGDYLGFRSSDIEIDNLDLDGNYAFDSAKNLVIRNSVLRTKDAFWNVENVTVINSTIIGEYLGWNSKNVTFINCVIESHQGLCYMDNVKMINCQLINTDLCFEYCSNIDADIITVVDSIKNPYSGTIRVLGVKETILEDEFIDRSKTKIIIKGHE